MRERERQTSDDSRLAILASIAANVAIAITKLAVAAVTHSAAMLAEGVHSLVNCSDGALLLLGAWRARRPADEAHPFGHGRELYFWSLIVAIVFFTLGAGYTTYEGIHRVVHPEPLGDPRWTYLVLASSALFDGASFVVGFRRFRRRTHGRSYWTTIRESKDPSLFSVVLEDAADLFGLAFAFLGVYLAHTLGMPVLDGLASIAIGGVLACIATILLVETHGLLIGESASPRLLGAVHAAALADDAVLGAEPPLSLHIGPTDVVVVLRLRFHAGLPLAEAVRATSRIARRIRREHPEVARVLLEPMEGEE